MLPVVPAPEPANFDDKVRQKGLAHLKDKNIDVTQPLPSGTKINNYWVHCLDDLYTSYHGLVPMSQYISNVSLPMVSSITLPQNQRVPILPMSGQTIVFPVDE